MIDKIEFIDEVGVLKDRSAADIKQILKVVYAAVTSGETAAVGVKGVQDTNLDDIQVNLKNNTNIQKP